MTEKLSFPRRLIAVFMRSRPSVAVMGLLLRMIILLLATSFLTLALSKVAVWNVRGFGNAIELLLASLWLAYLSSLARGKLRDLFVVVCSIMFGLAALEALAAKSEAVSPAVVGKGFFAYKTGIGWGAAGPGSYPARKIDPRSGAVVFDVTYTIDQSLLRTTVSSHDGPTVAFVGDSFTFGEGVKDTETLPQVFADLTDRRLHVLNFGFNGYGPQQVFYMLETGTFDGVLGDDVRLLVLTTAPWQAERTACKPTYTLRSPSYRLNDNHIVRSGTCSEGLGLMLREWIQKTALYRVMIGPYLQRVDHDDIDLYIRIVLATAELAKKKYGATTLIAYVPAGEDYLRQTRYSDAMIVDSFRAGGISVIDASLANERAAGAVIDIPGDGHPTAFAHFQRAQAIKSFVAREMPDVLTR